MKIDSDKTIPRKYQNSYKVMYRMVHVTTFICLQVSDLCGRFNQVVFQVKEFISV